MIERRMAGISESIECLSRLTLRLLRRTGQGIHRGNLLGHDRRSRPERRGTRDGQAVLVRTPSGFRTCPAEMTGSRTPEAPTSRKLAALSWQDALFGAHAL